MTILEIKKLEKSYGDLKAVKGIDFTIEKGEIFGLLGPNGAGKSTTISMISTLFAPDKGSIHYKNTDILKKPKTIQSELGIVPQEIALYPTLSGYENLKFWGRTYGLKGAKLKERIEAVSDIIGIHERLHDRVEKYSGGMKRRLNIGAALLHEPEILIMDEPTVGIDPQSRNHILETVKKLNESGLTIIYTSHYMEEVEFICDRIYIMDDGLIIASGTKEELIGLLGDISTVKLAFDHLDDDFLKELADLSMVQALEREGEEVILQVKGNGLIKAVSELLQDSSRHLISLESSKPNLEQVFLHLTGKALRD